MTWWHGHDITWPWPTWCHCVRRRNEQQQGGIFSQSSVSSLTSHCSALLTHYMTWKGPVSARNKPHDIVCVLNDLPRSLTLTHRGLLLWWAGHGWGQDPWGGSPGISQMSEHKTCNIDTISYPAPLLQEEHSRFDFTESNKDFNNLWDA